MRKVLVILGQLRDTDAEWMARVGSKRTVPDGEILITEGERNASLFILLDGKLWIEDAKIGFWTGLAIANADEMPSWNEGDEFEAARLKSLEELEDDPLPRIC